MTKEEFRRKMEKLRRELRERLPDQEKAVDETFDKMISEAVALKKAGDRETAPHHYMHLVAVLVGKPGDRRFWSFLEAVRRVLIVDFLQHDIPKNPQKDLD